MYGQWLWHPLPFGASALAAVVEISYLPGLEIAVDVAPTGLVQKMLVIVPIER